MGAGKGKTMKIRQLIKKIPVEKITGTSNINVKGITYDSRRVEKDFLFVAIPGFKVDGHNFIREAWEKGARTFVIEKDIGFSLPGAVLIKVSSSRLALAQISNVFYGFPSQKIKVVGITGTNGKTTTIYLIQSIFKKAGLKAGRISTIDYNVGDNFYPATVTTPESKDLQELFKRMLENKMDWVVMEVSSHSLVLHRVEGIDFDWAVFTNLSPEHLDFHRSIDKYLEAKLSLFKKMGQEKKSAINIDDPASEKILKNTNCQIFTYGMMKKADFMADTLNRSSFLLRAKGKKTKINFSLLGIHNVYNALAAAAVTIEEGVSLNLVKEGLEDVKRVPGRLELIPNKASLKIYVDYAHTQDGLEKVLRALRQINKGRLIVVFGCGGDRDSYKRPLMGKVAFQNADLCIITSDNPRSEDPKLIISQIEEGLKSSGAKLNKDYFLIPDRREAIAFALNKLNKNDTLLVAGKGHERVQIFKDRVIKFNDKDVIQDLLSEKGML